MRFVAAVSAFCALLAGSIAVTESNGTATPSPRRVIPSNFSPPQVFKNINLLRNTNLEKGYVRETINVVIENIDRKPQSEYYIAFPTNIYSKVGGLEVHDKNDAKKGKFEVVATDPVLSRLVIVSITESASIWGLFSS
jgi:oligosaccharyltransferase complex subunit alpha (ribophorin I)